MLKVIDYAILSNHVYTPKDDRKNVLIIKRLNSENLRSKNKIADNWYHITDADPWVTPERLFFAALYIKYVSGQPAEAVIAIRGTVGIFNKLADAHSWWSDIYFNGFDDSWPPYALNAGVFFRKARDYLKTHFSSHLPLTLTGHSLGGALAQFITACMGHPVRTITFNSPGIGHMKSIIANSANYIHGINSRYDFINKIGEPFGYITYVDVVEKEAEAKRAWEELKTTEQLVTEIHSSNGVVVNALLLDAAKMELLLAKHDVQDSLLQQHSIDNIIYALRDTPVVINA